MKKLFLLLLLLVSFTIVTHAEFTYGYVIKNCQHRETNYKNVPERRIKIDSTYQASLKLNVNDTDSWQCYILFLHAWPPGDPAWTQEMEKSAASHGANMKMLHGYETFYSVDDPRSLTINANKWLEPGYSRDNAFYREDNERIYSVADDLISSKDTSSETSQILGFIFYEFKKYVDEDTTLAKRIINCHDTLKGYNWPWIKMYSKSVSNGSDFHKTWAYTMMARTAANNNDMITLKSYGDILEGMGVNMDNVVNKYKLLTSKQPTTASEWFAQAKLYGSDKMSDSCLNQVLKIQDWKGCEDCHTAYDRLAERMNDNEAKIPFLKRQITDPRIPLNEKWYGAVAEHYQNLDPPQIPNALKYWNLTLSQQGPNSLHPSLSEYRTTEVYKQMSECYKLLGNVEMMKKYHRLGYGY